MAAPAAGFKTLSPLAVADQEIIGDKPRFPANLKHI